MGNQVCRYTMLTRPPEPMCSLASLGASGAAKMPFYEAADHACHRSSTIHEPRELMDRVRRCTGEMFQPTRLKGRTVNTLAPLSLSLSFSLFLFLSLLSSRAIPPRALRVPVLLLSLYSIPHSTSRLPLADTARAPLRPRPRSVHFSFRLIFFRHSVYSVRASNARNDVHGYCVTLGKRDTSVRSMRASEC